MQACSGSLKNVRPLAEDTPMPDSTFRVGRLAVERRFALNNVLAQAGYGSDTASPHA